MPAQDVGGLAFRRLGRNCRAVLGLDEMLAPEMPRSNAVTAIRLPHSVTYEVLHDRLKEQGYIIYAGQGGLSKEVFRVATMGELSLDTLRGFLEALEWSIG